MEFEDIASEMQAEAAAKGDEQLKSVSALVAQFLEKTDELTKAEAEVEKLKKELRTLAEDKLPSAMDSLSLTELKHADGRKVVVSDVVRASIPAAMQQQAFAWLVENGHGSLIKKDLKLSFGKGEGDIADEVVADIKELFGLDMDVKESVHAQTLTAFCREQLAAGVELPAKELGLYQGRVTKITK